MLRVQKTLRSRLNAWSRRRRRVAGRALALALVLGAAGWSGGCDEKLSDITGPTPNLEPRFSSIQREIFDASCVGCHTSQGRSPAGGLDLRAEVSYGNLVNVASQGKPSAVRVVPGSPAGSYLIHKLEGGPDIVGSRMPFGGTPLTPGQIAVIRQWIESGAQNN